MAQRPPELAESWAEESVNLLTRHTRVRHAALQSAGMNRTGQRNFTHHHTRNPHSAGTCTHAKPGPRLKPQGLLALIKPGHDLAPRTECRRIPTLRSRTSPSTK